MEKSHIGWLEDGERMLRTEPQNSRETTLEYLSASLHQMKCRGDIGIPGIYLFSESCSTFLCIVLFLFVLEFNI